MLWLTTVKFPLVSKLCKVIHLDGAGLELDKMEGRSSVLPIKTIKQSKDSEFLLALSNERRSAKGEKDSNFQMAI